MTGIPGGSVENNCGNRIRFVWSKQCFHPTNLECPRFKVQRAKVVTVSLNEHSDAVAGHGALLSRRYWTSPEDLEVLKLRAYL